MKLADSETFTPIEGPVQAISGASGIESLVNTVIGFLTVVGGVLFLIWMIIGAYNWITAEGKPEKLEKARNHITQAITGLIILVAAFAITALISTILGLNFLNLADAIDNLSQ